MTCSCNNKMLRKRSAKRSLRKRSAKRSLRKRSLRKRSLRKRSLRKRSAKRSLRKRSAKRSLIKSIRKSPKKPRSYNKYSYTSPSSCRFKYDGMKYNLCKEGKYDCGSIKKALSGTRGMDQRFSSYLQGIAYKHGCDLSGDSDLFTNSSGGYEEWLMSQK